MARGKERERVKPHLMYEVIQMQALTTDVTPSISFPFMLSLIEPSL